jgi:hypothetical protein
MGSACAATAYEVSGPQLPKHCSRSYGKNLSAVIGPMKPIEAVPKLTALLETP